ncbi:TPA: hypothetical protein OTR98_004856 [Pseudomonas aeruginosa]|nr:hypothetical protein [Pseudomonas aeruginosa]
MSKELNKAPVEQAGGDERVIGWRERILAAHPNSDPGFWPDALLVEHMAAEIADLRAALAQPSPTPELPERGTQHRFSTNEQNCRHDFAGVWWNDNGETKTGRECRHCGFFVADVAEAAAEQAEAERPEVVAWRYGSSGGILSDKACLDEWKSGGEYQSLMTVAQHERIVKAWIERWKAYIELSAKIAAQRDAADARLHEVATACATAEQERDAALARVAELERGKVYVEARRCDECQHGGINDSATGVAACHECDWAGPEPEEDKCPGCQRENCMAAACPQCGARYVLVASEEIAAPVAQAQQLHDLDKQCRDDVARALGLRPSQERGFAWSYLLASIKSCAKASEDAAQAQHSVPELDQLYSMLGAESQVDAAKKIAELIGCRMSRSALTEAQMRRIYENSTEIENERLGFAAFARLMRRAEAVHQIAAAPGKEGL